MMTGNTASSTRLIETCMFQQGSTGTGYKVLPNSTAVHTSSFADMACHMVHIHTQTPSKHSLKLTGMGAASLLLLLSTHKPSHTF
jgi:hypothetical protein